MIDNVRQYYWDTDANGLPQYVTVKRSRSYGHHTPHPGCSYYRVSRDEWDRLVERNRILDTANQEFGAQNDALRLSLSNMQAQIDSLYADNESLRLSSGSSGSSRHRHHRHHSDSDKLRKKVSKLEAENESCREDNFDLRWRLRELSKQLDEGNSRRTVDLQRSIESWTRAYHDMRKQYDDVATTLRVKTEKLLAYEDILRRNGLI